MKVSTNASVGEQGRNMAQDVKVVQALLNTYFRHLKQPTLAVDGSCGAKTIGAISAFQKDVVKLAKPDGRVDPGGKTYRVLYDTYQKNLKDGLALVKPAVGIVTFEAEGMEGGYFHSRILHVPGSWSGVTIGRGYDMGMKSTAKIQKELQSAGLSAKIAAVLGKASGHKGASARQFIIDNDLLDLQITPIQQNALFAITYGDEEATAKRICTSKAVEASFGACDWDKLDSKIREIVVDLKYRGDYTRKTRNFIQPPIVANDLAAFKVEMLNRNNWKSVPKDRFDRRNAFLK